MGQMWHELTWTGDPHWSGGVIMVGVLVVGGKRKKSLLTEPKKRSEDGPAGLFDRSENLYPEPVLWVPGDNWTVGTGLAPVASFFLDSELYPQPDNWHPFPDERYPLPGCWIVNGIIDDIYGRGEETSAAPTQLLLMPLGAKALSEQRSPSGCAGIRIQYEANEPPFL